MTLPTCLHCGADNLRDYDLCVACESLRHFTDRPCRCESCANPDIIPAALRARFPGQTLVLIAKSDDPPELRRVEFNLASMAPEDQKRLAPVLCAMLRAA